MALPHHNNKNGSLEATFIFHSPVNVNVWFLNITFMPQDVFKSVWEVFMFHSYGEEFLGAMCEKDSRSNLTSIKNPWANNSHLNSSHNITLQVSCSRVKGIFSCCQIWRIADIAKLCYKTVPSISAMVSLPA